MEKGTTTRRFKTSRPVTDSELLNALKNSMDPIFAHLEEKLLEGDGKVLEISVSVKAGKIKLQYGIGEMPDGYPCRECGKGDLGIPDAICPICGGE